MRERGGCQPDAGDHAGCGTGGTVPHHGTHSGSVYPHGKAIKGKGEGLFLIMGLALAVCILVVRQ